MWRLLDLLFPPRTDEAVLRTVSPDHFLALVAPRLVEYTHPETTALLPFHNLAVRAALHEAKYHGSTKAFTLLGLALAEYLLDGDDLGRTTSNIVVIPVPLGRARQKERGFNQVEKMLKYSGLALKIDPGFLVRTRETTSQVSLPREKRMANMRGAFAATRSADPSYTYIVIDDVITTGATLQAAIDALKEAGAENTVSLALAH
ncbi:MAG: phosphoribosyltransferase family protein [Candidatus Paceibacterota bacterium]